ncbi:hypothetical protein QTO34_016927 [Cnephaeus nilssonii]|uniref:Uncharacterized protein n=1 Tax=Cnephaeus nilssonii TaxID=3371016 RepID=A0AA40I460_CNENI|nr:hypothetical protein QTO34_016927 [Eptesicus nilssonii]
MGQVQKVTRTQSPGSLAPDKCRNRREGGAQGEPGTQLPDPVVRRNAEGAERARPKNGRERRGTCLAADTLFRFAVPLVSGQCFPESQRPYLFAPCPASRCVLEAQRRRRLRLCCSALRSDRSGQKIISKDILALTCDL